MKKSRVFLVDDYTGMRDGMAGLINSFDHFEAVAAASNGLEAKQAFVNGLETDIVLLDLNMPFMDGYELAEWLHEERQQVKILVMTMGVERSKLTRLLAAGVSGIINKDTTRLELTQAFETIESGGQYYSTAVTQDIASLYKRNAAAITEAAEMGLSSQELAFVRLCATDLTYKEIGDKMSLSKNATETLRANLFESLGVKNRTSLAMLAVKKGLVEI